MDDLVILYQQPGPRYILVPADEVDAPDSKNARLLDMSVARLSPPVHRSSILAQGRWQPYEGDQAVLQSLLTLVGAV